VCVCVCVCVVFTFLATLSAFRAPLAWCLVHIQEQLAVRGKQEWGPDSGRATKKNGTWRTVNQFLLTSFPAPFTDSFSFTKCPFKRIPGFSCSQTTLLQPLQEGCSTVSQVHMFLAHPC